MGIFDILQNNSNSTNTSNTNPTNVPTGPSLASGVDMSQFTFDPSALERGVKAIRELNESPHAKDALGLAKMQEQTRQAEYMAQLEAAKIRQQESSKYAEEARKDRISEEQRELRETANYQARLNAALHEKKMEDKRKSEEERIAMDRHEFLAREKLRVDQKQALEDERRKTLMLQHELEMKIVRERTLSEFQGKGLLERENKDIHLEQMREQEKATRETQTQYRELMFSQLKEASNGVSNFVSDSDKMVSLATGVGLLGLAVYGSRASIQLATKMIEAQLGKPTLVRETSRNNTAASILFRKLAPLFKFKKEGGSQQLMSTKDVVFSKGLFRHLDWIAQSTLGTKQQGSYYRHVLLQGPPGTGKTLFARQLAINSGLDYAIISGGDISPLKENGPIELHKLFDWANASKKGTVLFIDEADAFLKKGRQDLADSEHLHNALTVFLQRTGTLSDKFMLVLASNLDKSQFDNAVTDRIDEIVHFTMPQLDERKKLWDMYLKKHIIDVNNKNTADNAKLLSRLFRVDKKLINVDSSIFVNEINPNNTGLDQLAQLTDGISARQISKLALALRSIAHHNDYTLSNDMAVRYVEWRMKKSSAHDESFFEAMSI